MSRKKEEKRNGSKMIVIQKNKTNSIVIIRAVINVTKKIANLLSIKCSSTVILLLILVRVKFFVWGSRILVKVEDHLDIELYQISLYIYKHFIHV